jgi:hypothetical protein
MAYMQINLCHWDWVDAVETTWHGLDMLVSCCVHVELCGFCVNLGALPLFPWGVACIISLHEGQQGLPRIALQYNIMWVARNTKCCKPFSAVMCVIL